MVEVLFEMAAVGASGLVLSSAEARVRGRWIVIMAVGHWERSRRLFEREDMSCELCCYLVLNIMTAVTYTPQACQIGTAVT